MIIVAVKKGPTNISTTGKITSNIPSAMLEGLVHRDRHFDILENSSSVLRHQFDHEVEVRSVGPGKTTWICFCEKSQPIG